MRHYSEIADSVSFDQPSVVETIPRLSELFQKRYGDSPTSDQAGITLLVEMATRQAMIMAFNDVTIGTAVLSGLTLFLLPFFSNTGRVKHTRHTNHHPSSIRNNTNKDT